MIQLFYKCEFGTPCKMSRDFIYLDFGEEEFAYIIGDQLYFPYDLSPLNETVPEFISRALEGGNLIPLEILQQATSQLVTVITDVGYLLVASSSPGNYQVLYSSAPLNDIFDETPIDVQPFEILIPNRGDLRPFDPTSFAMIQNAIYQQTVGQLFGRSLPSTPITIIEFPDAKEKLEEGWIHYWKPEPQLQSWTRPPNSMISLFDQNGSRYLVSGRVDMMTNHIYPPV